MSDLIQIGPGALFAAVALSPEWGREYRPVKAAVPVELPQRAELRAEERSSEQMALI
ncbi:hypothetical protein [Paraburkholderia mimosarum]|uniref:hypothetical protein n=1 Tax=Paraburkholderia mimosarum TaxID=312026 RepID=UPI0012DE7A18|nr:hypothetical protein [Paraburkholderia mimosarum]